MFRYKHVNSTRKFTIVAEIVSSLKEIYERDRPLRAVFEVKTLVVLFPPYPCEMKTNTAKFKSAAILALACFCESSSDLHALKGKHQSFSIFMVVNMSTKREN